MNKNGFTLLELLLSISIIAILSSSVFLWLRGYQIKVELDSAAKSVTSVLRNAQSYSASGKDSKNWGVYFDVVNNKFILFRDEGSGFSGATVKEENYLSDYVKINTGGCNEIIFTKPKGNTLQDCSIKIEDSTNSNIYKNISIGKSGLIY